ncbi:MAG: hypothetical protein ACXWUO_17780, partial [Allosphingosinicella sp.]
MSLTLLLLALAAATDPVRPDSFEVASTNISRWDGELRTRINWERDEPWFAAAQCTLSNGPVRITFTREVEGGRLPYPGISFNAEDLIEPGRVEEIDSLSLIVGSRSFQLSSLQWRQWATFANYPYRDREMATLLYGIGLSVFRESADDPWLPMGLLLSPMMDAEEIRILYRGSRDLATDGSSNREAVYGDVSVNVSDLR